MQTRRLIQILTDERGAALPLALIAMVMLTTLIVAFSVLATTEPLIANNQLTTAQVRAIAESGVERALWVLNNSYAGNTSGLAATFPSTAPAPYDGSVPLNVDLDATTLGVYRVNVSSPGVSLSGGPLAANEREIEARGFLPSVANPRARHRIQLVVAPFKFPDPPAALSVRGELQLNGKTGVSASEDTSCGNKPGTFTAGETVVQGAAEVSGATGSPTVNNEVGVDYVQNQGAAAFAPYLLSASDLAMLKSYAKSQGTYYQGSVGFDSSNRMPNGVIFVDSVSGDPVTATSDPSDMANVTIHGGAPSSADGIFKGWLIVNGSLEISGNFEMYGFGYVQNDLTYTGTGNGKITGAMLSVNIQDASSTTIDTNSGGDARIIYDCKKARGEGFIPRFIVKAGTYKELSD